MADRDFSIEVLIKARNAASKVLNDFARDLGKADDKLGTFNQRTSEANKTMKSLNDRLGPLDERLKSFSSNLRTATGRQEKYNDSTKSLTANIRKLDTAVQKLQGNINDLGAGATKASSGIDKVHESAGKTENIEKEAKAVEKLKTNYEEVGKLSTKSNQAFTQKFGKDVDKLAQEIKNQQNKIKIADGLLASAQRAGSGKDVTGPLNDRLTRLRQELRQLNAYRAKIHLNLDDGEVTYARLLTIEATINRIAKKTINPRFTDHELKEALHDMERLAAEAEFLDGRKINIHARIDEARALDNSLKNVSKDLKKVDTDARKAENSLSSLFRRNRSAGGPSGVGNLALSFQGFQIAAAIKYAQSLITTLEALGGELVAVSASAIDAGAAIGGALASGALQAVGPIALLTATLARLNAIRQIVNLRQTIQNNSLHTDKSASKREATDTSALANAQDSLRNSQEALTDAQKNLTQAREDAIRKLEDLVDAEEKAKLASLDSQLAFEDAKRQARNALVGGDAASVAEADAKVSSARIDLGQSNRDQRRTTVDTTKALKAGVEGDSQVVSARRQLADATRGLARAERDLGKAQSGSATSADANTAAQDRLKEMLGRLTPAERELYRNFIKLQDAYRKAFRPITDIIIRSFSDAVKEILPLFSDKKLLGAFIHLADQIATQVGRITKAFVGKKGFIEFFLGESAKNLPKLTDIFLSLSDAIFKIGKAAAPVFSFILDTLRDLAIQFDAATSNGNSLTSFFQHAKGDLQAFFDLLGAIFHLFTAIFIPASDEGKKSIEGIASAIDKFATKLEHSQNSVRNFFSNSRQVTGQIAGVLVHAASEIAKVFNPQSVKAFADVLNNVVLPGLGNALSIFGKIVQVFHELVAQEPLSKFARFGVTVLGVAAAVELVRKAFSRLALILANFLADANPVLVAFTLISAALLAFNVNILKFLDNIEKSRTQMALLGAVIGVLAGRMLFLKESTIAVGTAMALERFFQAIAAFQGLGKAARALATDLKAVGKANWVGILLTALTAAISAFAFFHTSQEKTKITADQAAEALDRETDAVQRLKDQTLDAKEASLQLRQAKLREADAQQRLHEIEVKAHQKDSRGGRDVTPSEKREIDQAKADLQQSKLDIERAHNQVLSNRQNAPRAQDQAESDVKKGLKTQKDRVESLKEEIKNEKELIKKRKDRIAQFSDETKKQDIAKDFIKKTASAERDLAGKQRDLNKALGGQSDAVGQAITAFASGSKGINAYGLTVSDVMTYIANNANKLLKEFGVKGVGKIQAFVAKDHGGGFGVGNLIQGAVSGSLNRATGGIIPGSGNRDSVVAAMTPGEGVLNRHQMPIVDWALRASGAAAGGLQELWKRVQTPHALAQGGGINFFGHPNNINSNLRKLLGSLERRFPGLNVTSTTDHSLRTTTGGISDHVGGNAVDVAGSPQLMEAVVRYIKASGIARQLKQGIHNPGLSINQGQTVPPGFWGVAWGQHISHIHLALTGAIKGLVSALVKKINIKGTGPLADLAKGLEKKLRGAANHYISKSGGFGADGADFNGKGQYSKTDLEKLWVRAGGSPALKRIMAAIALAESGGDPNVNYAHGPGDGGHHIAAGLWQILGLPFPGNVYDPLTNAKMAVAKLKSQGLGAWETYTKGTYKPYLAQGGKVLPYLGAFKSGIGHVPQDGVAVLHQGEAVLPASLVQHGLLDNLDPYFNAINKDVNDIRRKLDTKKKDKGIGKMLSALRDLLADDGPFSVFADAIQAITDRLSSNLLRRQFTKIKGQNRVEQNLSDQNVAQQELADLFSVRGALNHQDQLAARAINAANSAVGKTGAVHISSSELDRRKNDIEDALKNENDKKGKPNKANVKALQNALNKVNQQRQARAGLTKAIKNRTGIKTSLATNLSDIFSKQEEFDQTRIDATNTLFDNGQQIFDVQGRIADAFGLSKSGIISGNVDRLQQRRGTLAGLQNSLISPKAKEDIRKQLLELDGQIAEATAAKIQDAIETINQTATSGIARADLKSRAADLIGRRSVGGFELAGTLRDQALRDRNAAILTQANGLTGVLQGLDPNSSKAEELRLQIADLNTQLDENTQAIQDNSDQIKQTRFDNLTQKSGFIGGVLSSGINIVKALGGLAGGVVDNSALKSLVGSSISNLNNTRGGLQGQLADLLGTDVIGNAHGGDLVNILAGLSNMDTSGMTPANQSLFQSLINAILENEGALIDNTQQLQQLTGQITQDFSTTSWQLFRQAVFNGNGNLLPQYASLVPQMATGGMITREGLIYAHAGERIVPAGVVRNNQGGDNFVTNITNPTEVLDENYVGKRIAYAYKSARASR